MTTTVSPASRTHEGVDLPLPGPYAIEITMTLADGRTSTTRTAIEILP